MRYHHDPAEDHAGGPSETIDAQDNSPVESLEEELMTRLTSAFKLLGTLGGFLEPPV